MKLFEIVGSSRASAPEQEWRNKLEQRPSASSGEEGKNVWIITPQGRRVGPFATYDAAASFRKNRPDKVPAGSRIHDPQSPAL